LNPAYKIFPLGDAAACIDLGSTVIDEDLNRKVIAMQNWLTANPFEGLKDIVIAYSSVSIYYDPIAVRKKNKSASTAFEFIKQNLETSFQESVAIEENSNDIIHIPVCYSNDFGIDMGFLIKEKNISRQEIIHLHTSKIYRVYMIGFLPGFSYLGKIDEKLIIPRKLKPAPVVAGSVGIAGSQTGIYPLDTPGGWQIIGRTPLKLFEANAIVPVTLNIGNQIKFYEISKEEFEKLNLT
jgi:inhibitor of KinA